MDFPTVSFPEDGDKKVNKKVKKKKGGGFQSMDLSSNVFKGVMNMGFKVPTPIQRKSIPHILAGRDCVAMGRTGSGKTAAFVIPMLERLEKHSDSSGVRALIMSPTRELALQIQSVAKQLSRFVKFKWCCLVGGSSMENQFEALASNPDIIVATPGRLMHHLVEVKFSLRSVEYLVFDEADRLFEMGFAFQLREILKKLPDKRQTCLFSATLPKALMEFTRAGLTDPMVIRLDADTKVNENLGLSFLSMRREEKPAALIHLLTNYVTEEEQIIVFVSTRHHVEYLTQLATAVGIKATGIYGQLDSAARKINMAKFRAKRVNVLLVTDLAARGIDIPHLDMVINFDFPDKPKLFVHRVGRTARQGRAGSSYSFISADEYPYMLDLVLFLGGRKLVTQHDPTSAACMNWKPDTDTNEITMGRFPHRTLETSMEYVQRLVTTHSLANLERVAGRAYKMVKTTRQGASRKSAIRAKALPIPNTHPIFFSSHFQPNENEGEEGEEGEKGDTAATMVTDTQNEEKREGILRRIRGFKTNMTILELTGSKSKDKDGKEKKKMEAMRVKRRLHDRVIKEQTATMAALKRKEGQLAIEEDEKQEEDGTFFQNHNDGNDDNDDSDDDDDVGGECAVRAATGGRAAKGSAMRKGRNIKNNNKNKDSSDTGATPAAAAAAAAAQAQPGLPTQTRKRRKPKRGRGAVATTSTTVTAKASKKRNFKDSKFFISVERDPQDTFAEDKMAVHQGGGSRMEDMVMDLAGDDHESIMAARKVKQWDRKKKRYVQTYVGGDPYYKQRNESGELIQPKGQPKLYEAWKKKTKKSVHTAGGTVTTVLQEAGVVQSEGKEESNTDTASDNKMPTKKRNRKGKGKGGKAVKSELKGMDELRKERMIKEKRASHVTKRRKEKQKRR